MSLLPDLRQKFIKTSTIAQFAAAKVSMVSQTLSLILLIALSFTISKWLAAAIVVSVAGLAILFVYLSGWAKSEYEFAQHLNSVNPRLDRIEAKLEEIASRDRKVPNEHIFDRR